MGECGAPIRAGAQPSEKVGWARGRWHGPAPTSGWPGPLGLGLIGGAALWQAAGMSEGFDGERIALERISAARESGQDWLDLGGLGLTRLPDALFGLTGLRRLNLGHRNTLTVEGWIGRDYRRDVKTSNRIAADLRRLALLQDLEQLCLEEVD